ncbi:phosphopantetheine-binding protein [Streptomyces sp. NBC_00335]|uniref:phosphopantetheine-binding protein n=1 Tax=unclassified Streptomyces TaxID=2593676 RepID=UPI00225AA739|nr:MULTISPECIES: phosphopantetheine-binding protein [unclassified Streptomyces]MCX5403584.1 phosphopantetheine-binding protein [Streptomyces sp. NBC_00086]
MEFDTDSSPILPGNANNSAEVAEGLWREILGPEANIGTGFLENGGDSFRAVLLVGRIYELTGREIDYLDVLQATEADAIARLIAIDNAGS